MISAAPKTSPSECRCREQRNDYIGAAVFIVGVLAVLAVTLIAVVLATVPAQIHEQPPAKPAPTSARYGL